MALRTASFKAIPSDLETSNSAAEVHKIGNDTGQTVGATLIELQSKKCRVEVLLGGFYWLWLLNILVHYPRGEIGERL
jgi:hypothetical protein